MITEVTGLLRQRPTRPHCPLKYEEPWWHDHRSRGRGAVHSRGQGPAWRARSLHRRPPQL